MEFGFELNPDDQVKQLQEQLASARAQAARSDMAARISLQRAEYAENERDGLINTLENAFGQICLYKRENGNVVLFECICLYIVLSFFFSFVFLSLFLLFSLLSSLFITQLANKTLNTRRLTETKKKKIIFSVLCSLITNKQTIAIYNH